MIVVSHNELVAVSGKAFEGLRLPYGEADLIANMVTDLEMVGLQGIKHFIKALSYLNPSNNQSCSIRCESSSTMTIDFNNESILCHLPTVLGYILEKLIDNHYVILNIANCFNRWLAFGELCKLSRQGISIKACWYYAAESTEIMYLLNSGNDLPEIYIRHDRELTMNTERKLTIELSDRAFELPCVSAHQQHLSSEKLKRYQEASWVNGIAIEIDDWNKLKKASQAMLVPNNKCL
ncbi:DUF3726 domain-containing protein [Shewanella sp. VB17]|uniref:DUF3726 domain-containing protein n=1 Tax=Shewanella sp. VB17 TaxID=2739432 RepID=UPI001564AA64|nr:DUF3726 domain-containing protein [Shewanella sp. VB17]NRD73198.1 DUF3726 domain-containing protein [Shewanella sp. VB17]